MEILSQWHGWLSSSGAMCSVLVGLGLSLVLGYLGLPFIVWAIAFIALFFLAGVSLPILMGFAVLFLVFIIKPIRQVLISGPLMKLMEALKFLPKISETERVALEAGVVWAEAELFSGKPNFKNLMDQPYPKLTAEEQAFIDGPVEELCGMVDDWTVYRTRKIPEKAMEFIKKNKFLGMIIPKEYGGLGFSAHAHSEVIQKLSSRSIPVGITVMVPNSLGPGELVNHYGTQAQKDKYLRPLADGELIPCFGLTEPNAGSDAGSITSDGILFKGDDGKLKIKLNWNKRWITLAAISDIIGLAFQLKDPENLLGKGEYIGITCALIPSTTEGVVIGRRHDPLGIPFYNCPTQGKDVIVDAEEAIIGGVDGAGRGWKMLMDSLGAGRGISLPAQSAGGVKMVSRYISNHAVLRKQFGISIGKFEGVEEPISRIAGMAYYMEAMRLYTLSALDQGISPPVVTAMAKYNATEWLQTTMKDAMDVAGGAGISMGPRNVIAVPYIATPIAVTVEGANILTRTLMVFGQGALRAHPYAFAEVNSLEKGDTKGFDRAFWGHIGHIVRNTFRSIVLSATRGLFACTPGDRVTKRYFKKLAWTSARFAILSDMAMGLLGGNLKVKEKLTGRFADVLSWMYVATAVLRRYEAEGRRKEDAPFVQYSLELAFFNIQKSFENIYGNFDVAAPMSWLFKGPLRFWVRLNPIGRYPSDKLGQKVSRLIQTQGEQRDRLTSGVYIPTDPNEAMGRLEKAFAAVSEADPIERKIKKAIRSKKMPKIKGAGAVAVALENGVITPEEAEKLNKANELRWDAIQVDDFSADEFVSRSL